MIGEMGMECFVLYYLRNVGPGSCQFDFNIFETKIKTTNKNCIRYLLCWILLSAELVGRIILQFFLKNFNVPYNGI